MKTYEVKLAWSGESVHEVQARTPEEAVEKVMATEFLDSIAFEIDHPAGPKLAGVEEAP